MVTRCGPLLRFLLAGFSQIGSGRFVGSDVLVESRFGFGDLTEGRVSEADPQLHRYVRGLIDANIYKAGDVAGLESGRFLSMLMT